MYDLDFFKTKYGQTAGGIVKTASVEKMNAGNYEIEAHLKNGDRVFLMLSDQGNLVVETLVDYNSFVMPISKTAYNKMSAMLDEIEKNYTADFDRR